MPPATEPLHDEIHAFVTAGVGSFSELSLRLFRLQFTQNPPYRAYCEALGRTPGEVSVWQEIPPVPTDVFKSDLPVCCFPPEEAERVFLTSGTTTDTRGRHHLRDLDHYEASVRAGWKHADLPPLDQAWFLAPDPKTTPESSLAAMFAILAPQAPPDRWLVSSAGTLERQPLREAITREEPIILFSTALALLRLTEPLPLPPGSWIFQTGGYKGLGAAIEPAAIYQHVESRLGVGTKRVINEYGMTELSSQAYAIGPDTAHRCPPWMRPQTIDPATSQPLAPGVPGYLVFHDLANVHSVQSIRTQDFGRVIDSSSFILDGRDPGAVPRGCSRGSEAIIPTTT